MSGFSVYYDNKLLDSLFRGTALTAPAKYIGLFKSSAGLTDNVRLDQQEITGGSYIRVEVPSNNFTEAVNSAITNNSNIEYPVATSDWGTVTHIALLDSDAAGNVIAWGTVRNPVTMDPQPRQILTGDQFIVRANTMNIRLNDNTTV